MSNGGFRATVDARQSVPGIIKPSAIPCTRGSQSPKRCLIQGASEPEKLTREAELKRSRRRKPVLESPVWTVWSSLHRATLRELLPFCSETVNQSSCEASLIDGKRHNRQGTDGNAMLGDKDGGIRSLTVAETPPGKQTVDSPST